jgi:HJR/Mrr/RecB family endonuclease
MDAWLIIVIVCLSILFIIIIFAIMGNRDIKKDPELKKQYDEYMKTIYPTWPNVPRPRPEIDIDYGDGLFC